MTALDSHVRVYRQEARDLPAAAVDTAANVEVLIDLGIKLFESVCNDVGRWKTRVAAGQQPFDRVAADEYHRLLRELHGSFEDISAKAAASGDNELGKNARFQEARRELHFLANLSVDRVMQAERDLDVGKGKPLAEVMHELRSRPRA